MNRLQEIKRLAKLPRMRACEIAKTLGISPQLVRYYLKTHKITLR